MHWLILAIIAIALLLMAAQYPKIAFGLLGALIVAFVILYRFSDGGSVAGRDGLDPAVIQLDHVDMAPGYAGSYRFSGRISNLGSDAGASEIAVSITMEDCIGQPASCVVIGDAVAQLNLHVPPRQARDFQTNVYLGPTKPKGTVRWTHEVVGARRG